MLKPGDVVYVSPRVPKPAADGTPGAPDDSLKGQWSLQQVPEVSGALVAMDPHTGRVLAIVGGFSFAASQFDRATQARRQPGSSFKPLIYATALDNGYTPSSIIVDGPICVDQGAGMPQWCPKNYEAGSAAGPSTLRFGIEHSRNLMTVRLARDMGMPIIAEYAQPLRRLRQSDAGAVDGARRRRDDAAAHGDRLFHALTTAASRSRLPSSIASRTAMAAPSGAMTTRDCSSCAAREWSGQQEPTLVDDRKQVIDPDVGVPDDQHHGRRRSRAAPRRS